MKSKFNHLTFIEFSEPRIRKNGIKRKRAVFRCDCGNKTTYDYTAVKTGHTKQCWKCGRSSANQSKVIHNKSSHPLYRKWSDMKKRCYNPNTDRYKNYGGKGVVVCDEWKNSFEKFYNWCIANGWKKGLEIDRKDVEANYTPDNCQFATHLEQSWNKRNTFYVDVDGKKIALMEILHKNNLRKRYSTVHQGMTKWGKDFNYYREKLNIKV